MGRLLEQLGGLVRALFRATWAWLNSAPSPTRMMRVRKYIRLLRNRRDVGWCLLGLCSAHTMLWMFFQNHPVGFAGSVYALTLWPYMSFTLLALSVQKPISRFLMAVCFGAIVAASNTAICEIAWLVLRWPLDYAGDSCSSRLGIPIALISALIALLPLCWRNYGRRSQST